VSTVLEDLTTLSPKRLERRLEELASEALPCVAASAFDANPQDGLTVALWIEAKDRRDVLDLARVLESEPGGHVSTGWSLLSPSPNHPYWRLLLRVQFERPVKCSFAVRFDVRGHVSDEMRAALPLLLAATGFALGFNGFPEPNQPAIWLPTPGMRDCVLEVINAGPGD
jgi:hypothetical protein